MNLNNLINVNTPSRNYKIYISPSFGNLADSFAEAGFAGKKVCVVTDSNVASLYLKPVRDILKNISSGYSEVVFNAGEQNKTLETITSFYNKFMSERLDRKSAVIALGGGVCGDMAGFAASTYMRGIKYAQIPTTLLSQVDSSVGGKTGVDFGNIKNIIGTFYQPCFVYINVSTLKTLPENQFASGMAEALKHGLIRDCKYFNWMGENKKEIKSFNPDILSQLVSTSCRIKTDIVSQDEKESGLREILNYGHTFGHAIEGLCGYSLPHGLCLSIGMSAALSISQSLGYIQSARIEEIKSIFKAFSLPCSIPGKYKVFSKEELYEHMFLDKKVDNNKINIILLEKEGYARVHKNAEKEMLIKAIKSIW